MSIEIDGRVIRGVDINGAVFRKAWKALPNEVKPEAQATLRSLFFQNIDQLPAKLHCHQLVGKMVASRLDEKNR